MNSLDNLSIVVPVYNEQQALPELIRRLKQTCDSMDINYELIFVDDGSSDESRNILLETASDPENHTKAILLNRNYGQHAAIMCGFEHTEGEIVVTLDADLQNPPEEIPKLVDKIQEGCDVVGSIRTPRHDSLFRRVASRFVNAIARKASGVTMHDYGCMLRAYRRPIIMAMLDCHERSTFIPILANMFAHQTAEVEVSHDSRSQGTSKYDLWKLINLQFDLLTTTTTVPLRLLTVAGGLISIASVLFAIFLLIMRLAYGAQWAAEGIFTLFALLFFLVGAQFTAMGLVGEYIGRIYNDVRARPRYFVEKIIQHEESNMINVNRKGEEQ